MNVSPVITRRNVTPLNTVVTRPGFDVPHSTSFSFYQTNNRSFQDIPDVKVKSPSISGALTPRAPVVHFFVCDHANAKVKTLTDQFIDLLIRNGIRVYTERYLTHQPGYQVRAVSLNTPADFFFQIHSKTASPGHVRLYTAGQPQRMTMDEAIGHIWSWWRMKSGALSKEETELIGKDKLTVLLKDYADIDYDEAACDTFAKMIRDGDSEVFNKLRHAITKLSDGRMRVLNMRTMSMEWPKEKGVHLQRLMEIRPVLGLSPPLKELLTNIIDQSLVKVRRLLEIASVLIKEETQELTVDEGVGEILIESEGRTKDGSSWRMMLESWDGDQAGSVQIASYGDDPDDLPPMSWENFVATDDF